MLVRSLLVDQLVSKLARDDGSYSEVENSMKGEVFLKALAENALTSSAPKAEENIFVVLSWS